MALFAKKMVLVNHDMYLFLPSVARASNNLIWRSQLKRRVIKLTVTFNLASSLNEIAD